MADGYRFGQRRNSLKWKDAIVIYKTLTEEKNKFNKINIENKLTYNNSSSMYVLVGFVSSAMFMFFLFLTVARFLSPSFSLDISNKHKGIRNKQREKRTKLKLKKISDVIVPCAHIVPTFE